MFSWHLFQQLRKCLLIMPKLTAVKIQIWVWMKIFWLRAGPDAAMQYQIFTAPSPEFQLQNCQQTLLDSPVMVNALTCHISCIAIWWLLSSRNFPVIVKQQYKHKSFMTAAVKKHWILIKVTVGHADVHADFQEKDLSVSYPSHFNFFFHTNYCLFPFYSFYIFINSYPREQDHFDN